MFRLLAVILLFIVFSPAWAYSQSYPYNATVQFKKIVLYTTLYPVSIRDTLMGQATVKKYTRNSLDEMARQFLEAYFRQYFQKNVDKRDKSRYGLIHKSPVTFALDQIHGYVTRNLWENVDITIDNFEVGKNILAFQVSMSGEYIKVNSPSVTPESFDNSYFLEKDYIPQLLARCTDLATAFKNFLRT
jgi:hypothetical protein